MFPAGPATTFAKATVAGHDVLESSCWTKSCGGKTLGVWNTGFRRSVWMPVAALFDSWSFVRFALRSRAAVFAIRRRSDRSGW